MRTLIELFDVRPLENVIGTDVFHPERVIYICPEDFEEEERMREILGLFFQHRGLEPELIFVCTDVYRSDDVLNTFRNIDREYPDCAMDISGGTDAALFAAGLMCAHNKMPVFTYSRRHNSFFNIRGADFAFKLPCRLTYSVEDCLLMAGGSMRKGRVDNSILENYLSDIDPFFRLYLEHRRGWTHTVAFMQRISPTGEDGTFDLTVKGEYQVKGEQGKWIQAPEDVLRDLFKIGFLSDLEIVPGETVSFRFRNGQIRSWLRDVGSVLELYVYKACLDSGLFQDVRTSVVVEWEKDIDNQAVSNELDVMCTRAVTPVFISCKTCSVKTEALNELSVLRDRFGGKMARAAIVTTTTGGTAMRKRATELDITVIDLDDISSNKIGKCLKKLMQTND